MSQMAHIAELLISVAVSHPAVYTARSQIDGG